MKKIILVAVLWSALTCFAGVIPIFGLPLGGKFSPALARCLGDPDKSKVVCWIGKPFRASNGSLLGGIYVPGGDTRPAWAAHVTFDAELDKVGDLQRLKLNTFDGKQKLVIEESIARRFGLPTTTHPFIEKISSATWVRPEIHIELICKDECFVEFKLPPVPATPAKPRAISP